MRGSSEPEKTRSSFPPGTFPLFLLGLWFAAEFCLFYQHVTREVLWAFPGYWDQVRYLQESHDIYRNILAKGLIHGLFQALLTQTPNGNLLPTEAAVLYTFLGSSRLTALLILFAHWIALQVAAVATVRWLSGRWSIAIIALALLLLAHSPFQDAGGFSDFRIDFAAFCSFGVFLCLAIRSNLFADRGWGMLAGLAAAYLILLRFITLVYLGVIAVMFFAVIAMLWLLTRQPSESRDRNRMRLLNLLLIGGTVALICSPVFWHDRSAIQNYYVVAHATGSEKYVRAREAGVIDRTGSLLYYPESVWKKHAGPLFCETAVGMVIGSLLLLGLSRKYSTIKNSMRASKSLDAMVAYGFLVCCLLGPYLVLTIDVSKSPVVGNIFVPPLWAIVILAVAYGTESIRTHALWSTPALTSLAAVIFCIAVNYQVFSYNTPGRFTKAREDVEQVLELHDLIGQKCHELGLLTPAIATDVLRDDFFPILVGVTQWERHQMAISPRPVFSQAVTAPDEADVMNGLHSADFALLTLSDETTGSPYPFDQALLTLRPKMQELCDREMLPLRETSFFKRHVRLYMRPSLRVETVFPDWITEDGLTLHGTSESLRRFPRITLRGQTFDRFHFPNDGSNVTASLEIDHRPSVPVPASLVETNGQYVLLLTVPSMDSTDDKPASIRVHFNRYFVPRDIGLNDDRRHLVVRPPDSVHLD